MELFPRSGASTLLRWCYSLQFVLSLVGATSVQRIFTPSEALYFAYKGVVELFYPYLIASFPD
jgi:hypothetical protein